MEQWTVEARASPPSSSSSSSAHPSATHRGLDIFARRGSVIAVAIGGSELPPASPNALAGAGASSSFPPPNVSAQAINPDCPSNTSDPDSGGDAHNDWRPPFPRLVAFHDCLSIAAGWSLGLQPPWLDAKPTGASQAQSPCEDDSGDGKHNELLASCPAFRNELGNEPMRRLALSRHTKDGPVECVANDTWHREHSAAESIVLEDVSNVYLGGRLCAARQPHIILEPQDTGCYYYKHCFAGRPHVEYLGIDDELGPISVSMVKETVPVTLYRIIIRISDLRVMRVAVPEEALSDAPDRSTRALMRELLELVCPQIHFACLKPALQTPRVEEMIAKSDELQTYEKFKVGVLMCGAGQNSEEQMYNNEHSSAAFEEFLDFLGHRVRLKGFEGYKGGLDTRSDTTGTHSVHTHYYQNEIMFHVSTLLPFTPSNRQQLSRKRHIGNDMVTVVFQDPGALPFSPITVRSHFQHVFIIVRVNNPGSENVSYTVAVSRSKDVPPFGPPVPPGATFSKCAEFHDWIMVKILNAEHAVHRSPKFAVMAARTRREALKDLAENYVGAHANEGPARIASRFLGGSVKRRERAAPRPSLSTLRGALTWLVDVHDHSSQQRLSGVLGLSAEQLVILERPSGIPVFCTPTHSIIGWANTEMGLKIYYDHGDMLLLRCVAADGTDAELNALLKRLSDVTKGDEAKEVTVRLSRPGDSWGFHLQEEGVVTEVDMYQTAWKAGLRQGSRIVELDGSLVTTLSLEQMYGELQEREQLRLLLIAPASDGSPRRGCADPHCPAVKGGDSMLTPDSFAKQPMTYQEMFRQRNLDRCGSPHSSPNSGSFDESRLRLKDSVSPRSHSVAVPGNSLPYRMPKQHSISIQDNMVMLNAPVLNRAPSEEQVEEKADTKTVSFLENELCRLQASLQRSQQEKKALESALGEARSQLTAEKEAHEKTRTQLRHATGAK